MVIASIALLMALGGTSIAAVSALPNNSVGTAQLKGNAVISSKVKNRSLLAVDFAQGEIPRGPRGPEGPPGAPGATGATGATGAAGPPGSVTKLTGSRQLVGQPGAIAGHHLRGATANRRLRGNLQPERDELHVHGHSRQPERRHTRSGGNRRGLSRPNANGVGVITYSVPESRQTARSISRSSARRSLR